MVLSFGCGEVMKYCADDKKSQLFAQLALQ